jgi:Calx-beta domain
MPHDARMTMTQKLLRGLTAGVVGLAAATAVVGGGGQPGSTAACQRSIAIDPQVTVSEENKTLTFVVHTNSCASAGHVSVRAVDGTAKRPDDFTLDENLLLRWPEGDVSSRLITARITPDEVREGLLEDFGVVLVFPSDTVRITQGKGHARIFEDDGQERAAGIDDGICLISGPESCRPDQRGEGRAPFMGPIGVETIEPAHLVVALNQPNPTSQLVQFRTRDGGLQANVDYVPVSRYVFIPQGAYFVIVDVPLLANAFTQPGDSFFGEISGYTAGTVADPIASFTMVG